MLSGINDLCFIFQGVPVTFQFYGHTVNVLSPDDWYTCNLNTTQVFPHSGPVDTTPSNGDYDFVTDTPGIYYIACGLGEGYHCRNGMKATIVVGDSCSH